MARPQVVDGGDGLQIWRVAASILNKRSRTADNEWSSSLGVRLWASKTPPVKNKLVTKCHKGPQTLKYSLDKRPKLRKMDMRFGTWNVRSMYRAGSLVTVAKKLSKYELDIVGVQEVRWDRGGTKTCRRIYIFLWKAE
jgi:hypothetical protein